MLTHDVEWLSEIRDPNDIARFVLGSKQALNRLQGFTKESQILPQFIIPMKAGEIALQNYS